MVKKRPLQRRTEDDGLRPFDNALPHTKEVDFVFTPSQKDYGIDGEIQVMDNESHTGEFYKVQIKATTSPSYIEESKYMSFSLDISSAFFLIDEVKSPTVLIVVDTVSSKVFWHPIQTDQPTRAALEAGLDQQSITVHIDTSNTLSPDNYQPFHSYLQQAHSRLSQKQLLQAKTNPTLHTGMEFLSAIEQKTVNLEGFTPKFRLVNDPVSEGTVFSIGHDGKKMIDYIPSDTYRPELAPKLNIKTAFSTKTKKDRAKVEAFKKLIQKGEGSIELSDENIQGFKVTSGDTIIDDKSYTEGGVSLRLSPSIQKRRQQYFINNGTSELENNVEVWFDDGRIHIESLPDQALCIATSFSVDGDMSATFSVRINGDKLGSAAQERRLMEFFRSAQEIELSFIDPEGFRRKMLKGEFDGGKMASNEAYQFVKALTEIEEVSGVPITYPLPTGLKRSDVDNVFWVHKLLTQGKVTQSTTFNMGLEKKAKEPDDLKVGGVIYMTQSPPEIYLFGKPYVMEGFKQEIKGVITELDKKPQSKYKIRVNEAEISLSKET